MVLWLASRERTVTIVPAALIVGIAILHVIAASRDQFVMNVIHGEGHKHQVVIIHIFLRVYSRFNVFYVALKVIRDIGFMIPDLLQVVVPLFSIRRRSFTC